MKKRAKMIIPAIGAILICQLAGIVGSLFTFPAIPGWYQSLTKPSFAPPNWIFGPVWTSLYTLMGISLFLVWQKKKKGKSEKVKNALTIFFVQLILNTIWSFLFFGLKNPGLAFIEIIILWVSIGFTIYEFFHINKIAAYLLIPYFFWVSFASFLNFEIWRLNL